MSRRAELSLVTRRMRAEGLLLREIAERLGLSISTVSGYASDPDGSRAHARKTKLSCQDCGTMIRSDNPGRNSQQRCSPCHAASRSAAYKAWVIGRMHDWAAQFGCPPSASDWNRAPHTRAKNPAATRRQDDANDEQWPSTNGVRSAFGSWNAAIIEAGYTALRAGGGRLTDRATA